MDMTEVYYPLMPEFCKITVPYIKAYVEQFDDTVKFPLIQLSYLQSISDDIYEAILPKIKELYPELMLESKSAKTLYREPDLKESEQTDFSEDKRDAAIRLYAGNIMGDFLTFLILQQLINRRPGPYFGGGYYGPGGSGPIPGQGYYQNPY